MRRILAQAVAGHKAGLGHVSLENPQRRDRYRENRRLGDLGQAQLLFRSVEAELRQFIAERFIGLFKSLPRDGIVFRQLFAHAHGLGTLAGKNECDLFCGGLCWVGSGERLSIPW